MATKIYKMAECPSLSATILFFRFFLFLFNLSKCLKYVILSHIMPYFICFWSPKITIISTQYRVTKCVSRLK